MSRSSAAFTRHLSVQWLSVRSQGESCIQLRCENCKISPKIPKMSDWYLQCLMAPLSTDLQVCRNLSAGSNLAIDLLLPLLEVDVYTTSCRHVDLLHFELKLKGKFRKQEELCERDSCCVCLCRARTAVRVGDAHCCVGVVSLKS
jgi:hypothetical protein